MVFEPDMSSFRKIPTPAELNKLNTVSGMPNAPVNTVSAEKFPGSRFEILNMLAANGSVPSSVPTISVG